MKKALGKGLSALIPDTYVREKKMTEGKAAIENMPKEKIPVSWEESKGSSFFKMIEITRIIPNRDQPRKEYRSEAIEELAASIKEKGMLQPIIVKQVSEDLFELICGERRLRAATLCGLNEVPAVVKDLQTDEFLEWALIENIQREDLNALEEAEAYVRLIEERMMTQEEVARRVGKNRTTVANTVRLLRLPEEVRGLVANGLLSAGHARALLGLLTPEHQRQMAKKIVEDGLSVRQVEEIVTRSAAQKRKAKRARNLSPEITDLETQISHHLGTKVKIYPRKNKNQGRMEIHYFSLDDLDRLLEILGIPQRQ